MLVLPGGEGDLMQCVVEVGSHGLMYVPSFMATESGTQVTLKLLPQQTERN